MEPRDSLPMPTADEAFRWVFSRITSPDVAAELTNASRIEAEPFKGSPNWLHLTVERSVCLGVDERLNKTGPTLGINQTFSRIVRCPYWTPHSTTWYGIRYRGRLMVLTVSIPLDPDSEDGCRLDLRDFGDRYCKFEQYLHDTARLAIATMRRELERAEYNYGWIPRTFDPRWRPVPVPMWKRLCGWLGSMLSQRKGSAART